MTVISHPDRQWCYCWVSTVMTVISHPDSGVVLVTGLHCDDCHFTPRQTVVWCEKRVSTVMTFISHPGRQWCGARNGSPLWWLSFHTQTDSGVVRETGLHCDDCHFTPRQTVVWCEKRVSTVMTVISHPGRQWCGARNGSPLWWLSFHTQADSGVVRETGLHCDDCHFTLRQTVVWCEKRVSTVMTVISHPGRQWCGARNGSPLWWLSFHTQADSGVVRETGLHCDDCHFTPRQTVVWCEKRVSTVMTVISHPGRQWCGASDGSPLWWLSFRTRQWCGAIDGSPLWIIWLLRGRIVGTLAISLSYIFLT